MKSTWQITWEVTWAGPWACCLQRTCCFLGPWGCPLTSCPASQLPSQQHCLLGSGWWEWSLKRKDQQRSFKSRSWRGAREGGRVNRNGIVWWVHDSSYLLWQTQRREIQQLCHKPFQCLSREHLFGWALWVREQYRFGDDCIAGWHHDRITC